MVDSEPTQLDYSTGGHDRPSAGNPYLTAAGALSLTSALLQIPWFYIVLRFSWGYFVGPSMPSAEGIAILVILLIPSIVAIPLGVMSLWSPKRHISRTLGILGLLIVGFYVFIILPSVDITWPRWMRGWGSAFWHLISSRS